jgi:general secretion pathway protein K
LTRLRTRERGVVLLLVLWVFMTLGVLALDFSQYMRDDATTALNFTDETRGYYLAVAGMNRALFEAWKERNDNPLGGAPGQPANPPQHDPGDPTEPEQQSQFVTDGEWHEGQFGDGVYAVRLVGEDGRIPLNVENVDDELYQRLLKQIVVNVLIGGNATQGQSQQDEKDVETIVDSILDWRDCGKEVRPNGAEDDYYLGLKRPYRAKNGYFESTDELLYVRGITPDLLYGNADHPGLIDVFSPYPKGHELEINSDSVTPGVVRALVPEMSEADAEDFLAGRKDDPEGIRLFLQQQLDVAVPGLGARVVRHVPEYVRIESRADIRQKRNQASIQALVQLPGQNVDDIVVLEWLDRAPQRGEPPKLDADLAGGAPS